VSAGRDPFEIEPLSQARWERIERGIFERLDDAALSVPQQPERTEPRHITRVLVGAVTAAAAAAVVVTAAWLHRAPPLAPSHIETGADHSRVALGEAAIDVGPHSGVVVTGNDAQGLLLVLERGEVDCEVTPRNGRPPFVVQSGAVRVRVVGTRFHVGRKDDGSEVSVSHGTVEVTKGDAVVTLHAGERWDSNAASLDGPTVAVAAKSEGDAREHPPAPPASALHPSAPPRRVNASAQTSDVLQDSRVEGPAPEAPDGQSGSRARASSREAYEAASRLEASDPNAALARYRDLSRGTDPWAANALYAEGRLALERGDKARAERALQEYLARFPTGMNAMDARELLGRIAAKRH
jgi:hypothetical protein